MKVIKEKFISILGVFCLYVLLYAVLFDWSEKYIFSFKETVIFLNPKFIYKAYYLSWENLYFIFGIFLLLFLTFFCLFDWLIRKISQKRKEQEVLYFIDGIANEKF
ncbi:hypothetical protein Q2K23_06610 [Enterococcus faecium]|uniref:hypothetical protein n=1 Tax=Enterococcus faecium TaxID=1352 RepID=UPI0026602503|nr:hypothetical protein [Enterococcus faecium]MDO1599892.1 hypothetical protein [Enterococcus faecium]